MAVLDGVVSAIKRAAGVLAGLLPDAPTDEAERPDIDGRRRADLDPESVRRAQRAAKQGKGGYR